MFDHSSFTLESSYTFNMVNSDGNMSLYEAMQYTFNIEKQKHGCLLGEAGKVTEIDEKERDFLGFHSFITAFHSFD